MNIGIISDIHGNIEALEAVLERLESTDIIICAGDIVGHGPNPEEVINLLKKNNIIAVKGNYDDAVANIMDDCGCLFDPVEIRKKSLEWTIRKTSKVGKKYLNSLPVMLEAVFSGDSSFRLLATHASPHSMIEYLDNREKIEHAFKDSRADVVIFGHTHKPRIEKIGNTIYINPGSVGEPRDGNVDASYAILDTQTMDAKIGRIAYDVKAVADRIMKHNLPEEIASIFRTGKVPWEEV